MVLSETCRSYTPYKRDFSTWLDFKFSKLWGSKSKKEWLHKEERNAARCIAHSHTKASCKGSSTSIDRVREFTIGAMVQTKTKTIWREYSAGNPNEITTKIYAKDIINEILGMDGVSTANKNNLNKLLTGYGEYDSVRDIAKKNKCSHESLYKSIRDTRKQITPEILDTYKAFREQPYDEDTDEKDAYKS